MNLRLAPVVFLFASFSPASAMQQAPVARCDASERPEPLCVMHYVEESSEAAAASDIDRSMVLARKALAVAALHPDNLIARQWALRANSSLAAAFEARGRFRDAEEYLRRNLQLSEALEGRSVEMLLALLSLSKNLLQQGRYADAEKFARGGVDLDRMTEYELKPILSVSLRSNLAAALVSLGRLSEAETIIYEMAMALHKKLGDDFGLKQSDLSAMPALLHARVNDPRIEDLRGTVFQAAMLMNQLGDICTRQGDSERCIEFVESAAHFLSALHPEWQSQTADSYSLLVPLYRNAGRIPEAVASSEKALKGYRAVFGPANPLISGQESITGRLQFDQLCQPWPALQSFRRAAAALLDNLNDGGASNEASDRLKNSGYVFRNIVAAAWASGAATTRRCAHR